MVHGKEVKADQGRFFIMKVLKKAMEWKSFDLDKMCEGAAILWGKGDAKKISAKTDLRSGTESKNPTVLAEKKRKRNPEKWLVNKRRRAINSGKEFQYETKIKGKKAAKEIKKKEMKPPCNCRMKCIETFTEEKRIQIFNDFYSSGDKSIQSHQIGMLVKQTKKKRERKSKDKTKKERTREFTRTYSLCFDDEVLPCCSVMFYNTLVIDEKRVRSVLKNKTTTGTPILDRRGRHGNHRRCEEREGYVKEHIKQFNVVESHYVRKGSKFEYLPAELSVAEMYRMYNNWRIEKGYPKEDYAFYHRVFTECFNLKFQLVKKDRCDTCETFKNRDKGSLEDQMQADQDNHLKDKETVRNLKDSLKRQAKEDQTLLVAAFDLQKVLLSPFGQTGSFYYSRRLANHNFTITNIANMETYCYFWTEAECQKGSCEVATGLLKYIADNSKKGVKRFEFFSDRCGGQNNNRMVFIMLCYALTLHDIDSVTLTYLVSGHSQNENDNAHSVIEKMVSKKTIYTPAEWEAVIQCAFKKNPCVFTVLEHGDIIDFKNAKAFPEFKAVLGDKTEEIMTKDQKAKQKQLNIDLGMPNRKVDKIFWSEIVSIKFCKKDPEAVFFKYSFNEEYRRAIFRQPKHDLREKEIANQDEIMRKYSKPCGVTQKKKDDLLTLCRKQLIPSRHHHYYNTLPVNKKSDTE